MLALLCCISNSFGQPYFSSSYKQRSISFKLVKNLIIIPLYLNGKGPFNFILDTGVGLFIITEPSFIDSLSNKENNRTIKISGLGEEAPMEAYIHPSATVSLANHAIMGEMPVAVLKDDPFDLSSFVGMPVYGIIGYELFSSFIVKINYSSKRITFYRNSTAYVPRRSTRIPISIEDKRPYLNSEIQLPNGIKETVKLIIDTGAGHPLSLETRNGIAYEVPEKNIPANLGVGLSGAINGFISRIPGISLGKFYLENVICAFPDYSNVAAKITTVPRDGNLGNNVLKHFNIVLDYQRSAMYLRPNYLFREPFEHDMSGMELAAGGENLQEIVVARVESNSAAELIGIKKGDRILKINFKDTREYELEEITQLFYSLHGRKIVLLVLPVNKVEPEYVVLTLKRRI